MTKTYVKICGMTNLDDALEAVSAGADLIGFIFYEKSPRSIQPLEAANIVAALRSKSLTFKTVGVFVNAAANEIQNIQSQVKFDYAQLHGDESVEFVRSFANRAFKVLRSSSRQKAVAEANLYAPLGPSPGPRWLIDAYDPTAYGGTGQRADWQTAAQLAHKHPGLLLAGGLTPENVAEAIKTVHPWGIDLASGVEARPGIKDHAKIRSLLANVRSTDEQNRRWEEQ